MHVHAVKLPCHMCYELRTSMRFYSVMPKLTPGDQAVCVCPAGRKAVWHGSQMLRPM